MKLGAAMLCETKKNRRLCLVPLKKRLVCVFIENYLPVLRSLKFTFTDCKLPVHNVNSPYYTYSGLLLIYSYQKQCLPNLEPDIISMCQINSLPYLQVNLRPNSFINNKWM